MVKNSSPAIYSTFVVTDPAVYVGADNSTAPEKPTGINFSSLKQTSLVISWTAPSPGKLVNGIDDDTISSYTVYYHTNQGFDHKSTGTGVQKKENITPVFTTIENLTEGTTYYFKVTATNNFNEGPPSTEEVKATIASNTATASDPPTLDSVTGVTTSSFDISWVAPTYTGIETNGNDATITEYTVTME